MCLFICEFSILGPKKWDVSIPRITRSSCILVNFLWNLSLFRAHFRVWHFWNCLCKNWPFYFLGPGNPALQSFLSVLRCCVEMRRKVITNSNWFSMVTKQIVNHLITEVQNGYCSELVESKTKKTFLHDMKY